MAYLKFAPSRQLSLYIESIWIQESECSGQARPTQILPVGKIDLIFSYRDPFVFLSNGQEHNLPDVHIVGQRTHPVRVRASGKTGLLIVSFYPWGAKPLFGLRASEITDQIVDGDTLLKLNLVGEILERVAIAESPVTRVKIVQEFLTKLLDERYLDFIVREAVCRINQTIGSVSIENLASKLNISRRQLSRRFRETVGLGPKMISNIMRFQKAIGYKRFGMNWNDIIKRCGYYDQAHLIREFKSFSDITPQFFCKETLPATTSLMRHFNCNELSHFYNTIYL